MNPSVYEERLSESGWAGWKDEQDHEGGDEVWGGKMAFGKEKRNSTRAVKGNN
jgi:hypothetical protein